MNKSIEVEITKLKLESMDSYTIFKWLKTNKNKDKYSIIDDKGIVKKLYSKNDKLINIGLAMYSQGYTYEMYENTNSQKEKLAYLSSEVKFFAIERGNIVSELIAEYKEYKLDNNKEGLYKVEEKLKAFFSNENIYEIRCILFDLYCKECRHEGRYKNREDVFKNIDNELWLKLISYTSNQHILSEYDVTIDDTFAPDSCDKYLDMFWRLFISVETTEENAKMLVEMVEKHDAIRDDHSFVSTLENINRWQSDDKSTSFLFARYYLATTNENLLSSGSKDLAIRLAYYSSQKFVKELNKNLPDESKLDAMYGYRENYDYYMFKLEGYYSKDKGHFLTHIIGNDYALLDNLALRHALSDICGKDISGMVRFRERITEIDKRYPNLFKKNDELTEVDTLKNQEEKNQFLLKKIQDIDNSATLTLQEVNNLSFLPTQIKKYTNEIQVLLIIIIILEIVNFFF